MYGRMTKASLAIAAAAITITSAGLASALLAAAASPAPAAQLAAIPTVLDTNFAGYVTGGNWRFRYISADVRMAACRSAANQNAVASIALKSDIFSEVARIELSCGGGHGSVMFGTADQAESHFQLSPSVGDVLRISIFRNVAACRDEFTATNTRTNNTKMVTVATRARWSTATRSRAPPSLTSPGPGHRPLRTSGCGNSATSPSPATTEPMARSAARGRRKRTSRRQ